MRHRRFNRPPVFELSSTDSKYAKRLTADWLLTCLQHGVPLKSELLECFQWATGSIPAIVEEICDVKTSEGTMPRIVEKFASNIEDEDLDTTIGELARLCERNSRIRDRVLRFIKNECAAAAKGTRCPLVFTNADQALERLFDLSPESRLLCTYIFLKETYSPIETFFEDTLNVQQYANLGVLAGMLHIPEPVTPRENRER